MFSAVALVAFSFAGMANNEVKDVEVKEAKKKETVVKKEKELDCNTVRQVAYLQAVSDGFSHQDASGMAYSVYFNCLSWNL